MPAAPRVSCQTDKRYCSLVFAISPTISFGSVFSMKPAISCCTDENGFFLEGIGTPATPQEVEASAFAEQVLVPPAWRDRMLSLSDQVRGR